MICNDFVLQQDNDVDKHFLKVFVADTFCLRSRGLLFRSKLEVDQSMLIMPCNAVHSFFMRYSLDLVYLDKENRIVKIVENLKPWRFSVCFKAYSVMELNVGVANKLDLKQGDKIFQTGGIEK